MWDSVAFSINKLLDALWHPSAQTLHVEVIINVLSYALKLGCELFLAFFPWRRAPRESFASADKLAKSTKTYIN